MILFTIFQTITNNFPRETFLTNYRSSSNYFDAAQTQTENRTFRFYLTNQTHPAIPPVNIANFMKIQTFLKSIHLFKVNSPFLYNRSSLQILSSLIKPKIFKIQKKNRKWRRVLWWWSWAKIFASW